MTRTLAVVTPIIHRNGDDKATLIDQLAVAYTALRKAHVALQACAPNARNYYPEAGRMAQAETQHRQRQAALHSVLESLEAEVAQIEQEYPTPRVRR